MWSQQNITDISGKVWNWDGLQMHPNFEVSISIPLLVSHFIWPVSGKEAVLLYIIYAYYLSPNSD